MNSFTLKTMTTCTCLNLKHETAFLQMRLCRCYLHEKAWGYMLISRCFCLFVFIQRTLECHECLYFYWDGLLCAIMRPKNLTICVLVPQLNCCYIPYIFYILRIKQHYILKMRIVGYAYYFYVWPEIWQFLILKCTPTAALVSPSSM